jgi:poly-gamma-glutamate synthesis protein (capsule biosynthesis protein)
VGRALAATGFNVINHANSHTMDKGERAVFATMDFWDTIPGITVLGVHRSQEQRDLPKLITKNNITFGFLSYTYGTNGIPVPSGKPWLVSLINREIMAKEIDALRPLCDVLVVCMHWGEEYQYAYNRSQASLATFLAERRVDLIIGHHPHVLQPVEFIERNDGATMLCFYSLGNLISAQVHPSTLLGALAYIKIKKIPAAIGDSGAGIVFEDAGAIPVVTHYEGTPASFKVYPLYAYTEELAKKHWRNRSGKELTKEITLDGLNGIAKGVLSDKLMLYNPFE